MLRLGEMHFAYLWQRSNKTEKALLTAVANLMEGDGRFRPEDVMLSAQPIDGISAQNQLKGRVQRFAAHGGQMVVEIDVGVPLLAELSSGSYERLGLAPGVEVVCLLKANAVRVSG